MAFPYADYFSLTSILIGVFYVINNEWYSWNVFLSYCLFESNENNGKFARKGQRMMLVKSSAKENNNKIKIWSNRSIPSVYHVRLCVLHWHFVQRYQSKNRRNTFEPELIIRSVFMYSIVVIFGLLFVCVNKTNCWSTWNIPA